MKTITRKSLDNSIKDGAAYSAMLGLTQDYITPFALALKASVPQIGILSALPNLSVALSQLFAPFLSEKAKSRKSFVFKAVLLQAVCFLPAFVLKRHSQINKLGNTLWSFVCQQTHHLTVT
ncbi:MFS transporter [Dehalococcoides mccartyi]|uniref:MFS transporter n=1 Tax=Dehalococcoides mccartyi TaxID=61435 RepID=A0A2J1DTQ9_9CHLR|nr:MFS transporter [Dehalococcoides mccartyi]